MSASLYNAVKQRLYSRYIAPTEKKTALNAGIEIELPIVNLRREAVDFSSAAELRGMLNRERWPDFIDRKTLSKTLLHILGIADKGLRKRGKNEEIFLRPLYDRAEQLQSPAREYYDRLAADEKQEALILDYAALN